MLLLMCCCLLQWSNQPIYVLDKDNDLDVSQLALQNATDMVKVQPEGPYLVGGHSYGGAGEVAACESVCDCWHVSSCSTDRDRPFMPQLPWRLRWCWRAGGITLGWSW